MDPRSARVALSFQPEAARKARSIVRAVGDGLTADLLDDAELLASELVTNAVQHGSPVIELDVAAGASSLTVRVADGGVALPAQRRRPARDEPRGRGLRLVEQMAADWGVETDRGGAGKTVWFRLGRRHASGRA